MRRLWGLIFCAVAAVVAPLPAKAAVDPSTTRLHAEGRWLVDSANRVVLLHGVNNVDKDPPYMTLSDGFTLNDHDAELLAAHGLNTVRLGVEWDGMMPRRAVIDYSYLDRVKAVVDMLGSHGIRVLIDHHQDSMSHVFKGGNGFPAWAVTQSTPQITDDQLPLPVSSRTRTAHSRAPGATPTTPCPSSSAAAVPATWVPWPFPSS